jgi:gluconate 5-dehydrogenase
MKEKSVKELFDLSDRVAIVTGGGTGLGFRSAHALAECGASVIIASRRRELCEKAAERINEETDGEAVAYRLDVRDPEQVQKLVEVVHKQFGRIDIRVNNSGVNRHNPIDKADLEDWREIIDTNLTGTFLCCRAVVPIMIGQRYGKIINIGSIYGVVSGVPL